MPLAHFQTLPPVHPTAADPRLLSGYAAHAHWRHGFGPADYRQAIQRGNDEPIPRPVALVVQVPAVSDGRKPGHGIANPDDWLRCLEHELALHAAGIAPDRRLARVLLLDLEHRLDRAQQARLLGFALAHLRGPSSETPGALRNLDAIGIGPGAVGRVDRCVARNLDDPAAYCAALERGELPVAAGCWLGPDELARGDLVATLLDEGEADLDRLTAEQGLDLRVCFATELAQLPPDLVERRGGRLVLTANGRRDSGRAVNPLLVGAGDPPGVPVSAWRSPAASRNDQDRVRQRR